MATDFDPGRNPTVHVASQLTSDLRRLDVSPHHQHRQVVGATHMACDLQDRYGIRTYGSPCGRDWPVLTDRTHRSLARRSLPGGSSGVPRHETLFPHSPFFQRLLIIQPLPYYRSYNS